jgi:ubiquinone/menaquinone biosynthesis C-methylase UbiE
MSTQEDVKKYYDREYSGAGYAAGRMYPNEELMRFMGRNFFKIPFDERRNIKVLEVGCGVCSNLWPLGKENFDIHGIDISAASIEWGKKMFERWGTDGELKAASMTELPYGEKVFDVLLDVLSSVCLDVKDFGKFLTEANRVLKPGGKMFCNTFSAESRAFTHFEPSVKIDEYTLDGIHREDSVYYGNFFPLRFETPEHITEMFNKHGFEVTYLELLTRTYYNRQEPFQLIILEAFKRQDI